MRLADQGALLLDKSDDAVDRGVQLACLVLFAGVWELRLPVEYEGQLKLFKLRYAFVREGIYEADKTYHISNHCDISPQNRFAMIILAEGKTHLKVGKISVRYLPLEVWLSMKSAANSSAFWR